ncbi:YciI family protein [Arthrobacter sp. MA-N2]|uniref:YciI family protein n=1 Tax=Arthrobacter sp. MA-N2 TaxID=1101188 RepID=UPI000484C183|nr:YciI family protein [Arthrobacter sp. MA-N2]
MQFVVFYSSEPSAFPGLQAAYPRHAAYFQAFAAEGGLIGIGTFDDPAVNGSMGIFSSRERAEQFIAGDPFVVEGLAVPSEIREWNAVTFGTQDEA